MISDENIAHAYAQATDSTRHLIRWTQDNTRRQQRVKPDP